MGCSFKNFKILKLGFVLHLMMSNNRCLNVNVSLNKEDSAACIVLKAAKYQPDIKDLSSLVKQQIRTNCQIRLFAFRSFLM